LLKLAIIFLFTLANHSINLILQRSLYEIDVFGCQLLLLKDDLSRTRRLGKLGQLENTFHTIGFFSQSI